MTIILNLQMKALRKSYLRRSHGDALVEERTNPSCSLTSVLGGGSVSSAEARDSSAERATCALCAAHQPQRLKTLRHFISRTRRCQPEPCLNFLDTPPHRGAETAVLKGFGQQPGCSRVWRAGPGFPWDVTHTNSRRACAPEKPMARPDTHELVRTHMSVREDSNVTDTVRSVGYFTHLISSISFNEPPYC